MEFKTFKPTKPALALALAATLFAASPATAASTDLGNPLLLKQNVTVDSSGLHLSDLFLNLPKEADQKLANAPKPGTKMIIGARQLWQYAKSFKLNWRPRHGKIHTVVIRDSVMLPRQIIEDTVFSELREEIGNEDFDISIHTRDIPVHVAAEAPMQVEVRSLNYDRRSNRFQAKIAALGESSKPVTISGRVEPMVLVPTMIRHAMPGQVISASDIEWLRVPTRAVNMSTITREEDLVGMSVRRTIPAKLAIRSTDLQPNWMIEKRELVTIYLKMGSLTLTARGQALQRGAKGDVIRVRNVQSKKVIEGKVISADTVIVTPLQLAAVSR